MDVHSTKVRSYNMSQIRSRDTKPEEIVRKYLFSQGFRYRKNDKRLPGTPDIVLPKYKTVVFVNGCFWHKHDCKYFKMPKSNTQFWKDKLTKNVKRDENNIEKLKREGWNVLVVWQCQLKKTTKKETLEQLVKDILSQ